jgi:hypothetical protein
MIAALLALTIALVPMSGATAPPEDLVESSPRILVYENMLPGETRTDFLTVTSTHSKIITVLPQLEVPDNFVEEIDVKFGLCEIANGEEQCKPLDRFLKLEPQESRRISVSVSIDESLTEPFTSLRGSGTIYFTAGELVDENTGNVTTPTEQKHFDDLATTGGNFPFGLAIGGAGVTVAGLILLILAWRSRRKAAE